MFASDKPQPEYEPPRYVFSANRKVKGLQTGGYRRCQLEGCTGLRLAVRWPDGKLTYPCTKGMKPLAKGDWKILSNSDMRS